MLGGGEFGGKGLHTFSDDLRILMLMPAVKPVMPDSSHLSLFNLLESPREDGSNPGMYNCSIEKIRCWVRNDQILKKLHSNSNPMTLLGLKVNHDYP